MKKTLALLYVLGAATAAAEQVVTFVGDSITHGYKTYGYRYDFFKILVDNNIPERFVGINKGNTQFPAGDKAEYAGKAFDNVHCAGSSWRTYQTSGDYMNNGHVRAVGPNSIPVLGYINNWLDLQDERKYDKLGGKTLAKGEYFNNGIKVYNGAKLVAKDLPQRFYIMLGTNDLYSDKPGSEDEKKTFGYLKTIINSARKASPKAEFVVLSMPTVTAKKNAKSNIITPAYNAYIKDNLSQLQAPGAGKVIFADINPGITTAENYMADAMASDGLHPNEQGNLIIAGNLAKAIGYKQRNAGLPAGRPASMPLQLKVQQNAAMLGDKVKFDCANAAGLKFNRAHNALVFEQPAAQSQSISANLEPSSAATLVFDFVLDKSTPNNGVAVRVGDCGFNLLADRIEWQQGSSSKPLYYGDMRGGPLQLTLTLKPEKPGIAGGWYLWLGDQLIGEAKSAAGNAANLTIGSVDAATACKVQLKALAYDAQQAFAAPAGK